MTGYVGLFITVQVQIFITCNQGGFSHPCTTGMKVGGSILCVITYIVIIASWLLMYRHYRQVPKRTVEETTQPTAIETASATV